MHKAKTKPKELTFSVLLGWRCLINSVLWREKKPSVSCINMSNNVLLIISKSSAFAHILHTHNINSFAFFSVLEIFSFFSQCHKIHLNFLIFPFERHFVHLAQDNVSRFPFFSPCSFLFSLSARSHFLLEVFPVAFQFQICDGSGIHILRKLHRRTSV